MRIQTEFLRKQLRFIESQEEIRTPAKLIIIRCVCSVMKPYKDMYKCMHCGVFYCKKCVKQPFGQIVADYPIKKEKER